MLWCEWFPVTQLQAGGPDWAGWPGCVELRGSARVWPVSESEEQLEIGCLYTVRQSVKGWWGFFKH